MNFIEKLDALMAEKGINKHQLAEQSGIPYMTIVNFYKKGTENIKLSTLQKLSSYFNVSLDYISDDSVQERTLPEKHTQNLTSLEWDHIKIYRLLSEAGQKAIDDSIDTLLEYEKAFKESSATYCENVIQLPTRRIIHYDVGASAGLGNFLEECPYTMIEVGPDAPVQTSFTVDVDGDSMEPRLHDGELLYVREQEEIEDGEIGLFHYDGDIYVKKLEHRDDKAYLVSLNLAYKPIEIDENLEFACLGKVLNK